MRAALLGAAAAAGLVGLVVLRRRRSRSRPTPTVLFFGPAVEFVEPVRALLQTRWRIESASAEPGVRTQQAAGATALVGGLPPANALLRATGAEFRLLHCHFTGTDWLERDAVPPRAVVCNSTGMEFAIAEWVVGAMLRRLDGIDREDAAMRRRCAAAAAAGDDLGFAPRRAFGVATASATPRCSSSVARRMLKVRQRFRGLLLVDRCRDPTSHPRHFGPASHFGRA